MKKRCRIQQKRRCRIHVCVREREKQRRTIQYRKRDVEYRERERKRDVEYNTDKKL